MESEIIVDETAEPVQWSIGKAYSPAVKELIFKELHEECREAKPGGHLPFSFRKKFGQLTFNQRREIVSRTREGCAPLFLACKKGNVDIVEYLISFCGANVEQRGLYQVQDDSSKHVVTPLWCASVAGKLSVVKCLVEHGAKVDSVSDTGSTPVRSACFMTHYDIVVYLVDHGADLLRPNYNGGTCLINSVQSVPLCEFLIKRGADVNAEDIQCKTALHYSIQEHRIETAKLLLDHGADPWMKSRYGDDALQTACLKGDNNIFELLVERYTYSRERIAEAHELIGTTFLEEHHDIRKALHHWRTGLMLRYENPLERLEKKILKPRAHYLFETEFNTIEELENLVLDLDAMRMQSLVICERVLGSLHRDMIFRLMYRGAAYADSSQYNRCIALWRYALELRIQKDSLLHSEVVFAAQALVKLFLDLHEKNSVNQFGERVNLSDLVDSIKLLVSKFDEAALLLDKIPLFKRQEENFDKVLKVITHLIYVIYVIPKTQEEERQAYAFLSELLRSNVCCSTGDSLLHLAVSKANVVRANSFFEDTYQVFPHAGVAEMMLKCGANPECVNKNLSTPLHVASLPANFRPAVVHVLLKYGAHMDRKNGYGNIPCSMLQGLNNCPIKHFNYISLKCLAARKVMDKQIFYEGEVPVGLEDFIRIH